MFLWVASLTTSLKTFTIFILFKMLDLRLKNFVLLDELNEYKNFSGTKNKAKTTRHKIKKVNWIILL